MIYFCGLCKEPVKGKAFRQYINGLYKFFHATCIDKEDAWLLICKGGMME